MEKKRTYQTHVKTTATEDGEVIRQEIDLYRVVSGKDSFMRIFLEDISGCLKITRADDFKVLLSLWKRSEWNTGRVVIIKGIKEQIAKEIGLDKTSQVVSNSISRLHKLNILIREDTGIYYLNPEYFFKGYDTELSKTKEYVFSLKYRVERDEADINREERIREASKQKDYLLEQVKQIEDVLDTSMVEA
jgi:hypothetical protein